MELLYEVRKDEESLGRVYMDWPFQEGHRSVKGSVHFVLVTTPVEGKPFHFQAYTWPNSPTENPILGELQGLVSPSNGRYGINISDQTTVGRPTVGKEEIASTESK